MEISTGLIFASIVAFLFFGYWLFNFTILYHLTRFGVGTQPKKLAAIFLLGSITLSFISIFLLASLDVGNIINKFLTG